MKRCRSLVAAFVVGATCVVAHAELTPRPWVSAAWAGDASAAATPGDVASADARGVKPSPPAAFYLDELNRVPVADDGVGDPRTRAAVVRLSPTAPSSAALFLYALGSVGAWQLGRSARKLNLGCVPDWYHADARQIGHATPLDLGFPAAIVHVIATFLTEPPPPGARVCVGPASPRRCFPSSALSPRGPPR